MLRALLSSMMVLLARAAPAPDILFIVADDLGYNEVNFMNGSRGILTPNLDKLAAGGVVLSNYYVQPICSPTRSALMTGRYPLLLGTQANVIYWDTPWAVPKNHTFLPELLQAAGYETALFGKWHLGMFKERYAPWRRGFNTTLGYLQGCESAWTHIAACCGAHTATGDQGYVCGWGGSKDYRGYDWFEDGRAALAANGTNSAELLRAGATAFYKARPAAGSVEEAAEAAPPAHRPTFVYLAFQNIHSPYTVEARYRRPYEADAGLTDEERTMFGYVSEMDSVVGDVVAAMAAARRLAHGLVVFTSDNGAPNAEGVRDRNWPWRGFKTHIWEGGTRVAGFVHAPSLLPAAVSGTRSEQLFHVTDWLPTLVQLVAPAVPLPPRLSGHDIWGALAGTELSPRTELLYNINPLCGSGQAAAPKAALRRGRWKLMAFCYEIAGIAGGAATGPAAPHDGQFPAWWPAANRSIVLFDLESDPAETTDAAGAHPEVARELEAALAAHAATSVEPMQWAPPYQGPDYECASCPLRPSVASPFEPWTPWM